MAHKLTPVFTMRDRDGSARLHSSCVSLRTADAFRFAGEHLHQKVSFVSRILMAFAIDQ